MIMFAAAKKIPNEYEKKEKQKKDNENQME